MNYLYNGVELPDISAVWDKETYPYAFIYHNSWTGYNLHLSGGAILWKNSMYMSLPAPSVWFILTDGVWVINDNHDGTDDYSFVFNTSAHTGIWTSHDIPNTYGLTTYGEIYLAASTPIPCTSLDPTSLLQGYLVGRRLASLRGKVTDSGTEEPSGTIVGYSYNGVTLPALPEYDTAAYPYAYIAPLNGYMLIISSVRAERHDGGSFSGDTTSGTHQVEIEDAVSSGYFLSDGVWSLGASGIEGSTIIGWDEQPVLWCNTDILNFSDGSVYLAASDPVPVYE